MMMPHEKCLRHRFSIGVLGVNTGMLWNYLKDIDVNVPKLEMVKVTCEDENCT